MITCELTASVWTLERIKLLEWIRVIGTVRARCRTVIVTHWAPGSTCFTITRVSQWSLCWLISHITVVRPVTDKQDKMYSAACAGKITWEVISFFFTNKWTNQDVLVQIMCEKLCAFHEEIQIWKVFVTMVGYSINFESISTWVLRLAGLRNHRQKISSKKFVPPSYLRLFLVSPLAIAIWYLFAISFALFIVSMTLEPNPYWAENANWK